jgi:hypothetical protein
MNYYLYFLTMQSKLILLTATSLLASVSLPAQDKPEFTFTNKQHMVIVPFEQWKDHIYIKGKVNDSIELDFLFDPGAQNTAVVLDTSARAGTHMSQIDTVRFSLRTLEVGHQRVAWSALKSLELREGHPMSGVIGYEFIKTFVVRIDPRNKRIYLTDPAYFAGSTLKGKISLAGTPPDLPGLLKQGKTVTLNYERRYMIISE